MVRFNYTVFPMSESAALPALPVLRAVSAGSGPACRDPLLLSPAGRRQRAHPVLSAGAQQQGADRAGVRGGARCGRGTRTVFVCPFVNVLCLLPVIHWHWELSQAKAF